ncbi:MAG: M28 family peptidase [Sphingobacteriales bacterium]|nr:M28 family peptidase [Sphingobacteriales bacterium]
MKKLYYLPFLILILIVSCKKSPKIEKRITVSDAAKTITVADLQRHLTIIAGTDMEGRNTPSLGLEKAADYIIAVFQGFGLLPGNKGSFRQNYSTLTPFADMIPVILNMNTTSATNNSYNQFLYHTDLNGIAQPRNQALIINAPQDSASNIIGIIEGADKKNEYVIVSAHYDHAGKTAQGMVNYGADDNGSGTVCMMEVAEAFAFAKKNGLAPRRSVIFLAVSGEEKGLWGSAYYSNHSLFPLENTSAAINMDMIGRIGDEYLNDKDSVNYVYVIGDNKISTEISGIIDNANKYLNLKLDKKYNDPNDPLRIFYRSDQYSFAKREFL